MAPASSCSRLDRTIGVTTEPASDLLEPNQAIRSNFTGLMESSLVVDKTVFDYEVKNGADADLKTFAKSSTGFGNDHLKEAKELLAKLKK